MKKLIIVLAVLLIAAPAMAAVTITCTQDAAPVGSGKVTVIFGNSDVTKNVRALALDFTVDAGQICSAASLNSDYWVHPGSIDINSDGSIDDQGTPECDGSLPGTQTGPGTAGLTTEQASLYIGDPNIPVQSGNLLKLVVKNNCNLSVGLNAIRGGIIMEDGSAPAGGTVFNGCAIVGMCATCKGDVNNDTLVRTSDISALVVKLGPYAPSYRIFPTDPNWNPCADLNSDGLIRTSDISALVVKIGPYAPSYRVFCINECP